MLTAILPTKGRGEQAVRCINRFLETTEGLDTEILIMAYPDASNEEFMPKMPKCVSIHWLDNPLMECYNIGASLAKGNFLFDFDDDAWFQDGWLHKVYKTFDSIPNQHGYVKIQSDNSCYWAERAIGNRQFYIDVLGGVLSIPHYFSQWNDVEKSERAMAASLFFESDAYIEHRTWVYGKAQMDETYQNGSRKYADIDGATFKLRKAAGYPNDYEPIINSL